MSESIYAGPVQEAFGDLVWVMESENGRGNPPSYSLRQMEVRGEPALAAFRFPLDRDAIEAEFVFAPHIGWHPDGTAVMDWDRPAALSGGSGERGFLDRAVHRRWWRKWNEAPRPPRMIGTPIDESVPVSTEDEAERRLRRHIKGRARTRVRDSLFTSMFPEGHDSFDGFYLAVDPDEIWHSGIVEDGRPHTIIAQESLNDAVEWMLAHWREIGLIDDGSP